MERITAKQVVKLAEELGKSYAPAALDLQKLDAVNGQAWRIYVLADYPTGHGRYDFPGLDDGLLGGTNREAYQTLRGILAGMTAQRLAQAETIRGAAGQAWAEVRGPETEALAKALDELTAGF